MGFFDWIAKFSRDDESYTAVNNGHTVVYLREMRTPAKHWEDTVCYDAWGSPYVKNGSYRSDMALFPDGKTDATYLRGTEWKRKSGPEIKWPDKPSRPFA